MNEIIKELKQVQADAHALYIKMHNYHWNIKGMDFFPIHSKTEEIYNNMSVLYDDAAERVLQLGGKPHLTIKQLSDATKIKEETEESFKSRDVIININEDYKYLLELFKNISNIASTNNDKVTEAYADDQVAKLEKEIWVIGNMLQ